MSWDGWLWPKDVGLSYSLVHRKIAFASLSESVGEMANLFKGLPVEKEDAQGHQGC